MSSEFRDENTFLWKGKGRQETVSDLLTEVTASISLNKGDSLQPAWFQEHVHRKNWYQKIVCHSREWLSSNQCTLIWRYSGGPKNSFHISFLTLRCKNCIFTNVPLHPPIYFMNVCIIQKWRVSCFKMALAGFQRYCGWDLLACYQCIIDHTLVWMPQSNYEMHASGTQFVP